MSYEDYLRGHRRLSLLRTLADIPGYCANDSLLTQMVAQLGIASTRDQVRTELGWLKEQGLIDLEAMGGVTIATIKERGVDVSRGLAVVDGVQKPSPPRK